MLHTFKPQERSQSFTYGKPVNKTRSMVPSKSESPLLSIPQPHFSPSSHALLLQLPLLSCPCTTPSSTAPFHTFTPIYPRDMTIFPHLTWLIQSWSIYLLLLWLRLRFLGAADNSSGLSFTFTPHLSPQSQSIAITFGHAISDPYKKVISSWLNVTRKE